MASKGGEHQGCVADNRVTSASLLAPASDVSNDRRFADRRSKPCASGPIGISSRALIGASGPIMRHRLICSTTWTRRPPT